MVLEILDILDILESFVLLSKTTVSVLSLLTRTTRTSRTSRMKYRFFHALFCCAKRFHTTGTDRPWTSSFRMMLLALARSVTNRRAAGSRWNSFFLRYHIHTKILLILAAPAGRLLFLPCIQWTALKLVFIRVHSWFLTKLNYAL